MILQLIYAASAISLGLISLNGLVLVMIYLHKQRQIDASIPDQIAPWPSVLVQLPIYNEHHVVKRLIRAACQLDYPHDLLEIQVLDDSDDETTQIAAELIAYYRKRGINITLVRRDDRVGYKAGALAYGLELSSAEFVTVFDSDFVPPKHYLRQVIPHLQDADIGLVQVRWGHLNDTYSHLTRAEALALDNHFIVEQTARNQGGLLMNFSGTAGVWRRTCIVDSGGWHTDTLSEDIDLSYRAQMRGWKFLYLPHVAAPGEIPPLMMGFKRQQSRWATGTVQCLRKLGGKVWKSDLSLWQKYQAMLHLGGYFIHPLMMLVLLLSLPLMLTSGLSGLPLAGLTIAMVGPPAQAILAQRRLYSDWKSRLLYFPVFMLMGVGIAVNNTLAVARGFRDKPQRFLRTPKFSLDSGWSHSQYALTMDVSVWIEAVFALYALLTAIFSIWLAPTLTPFMLLYTGGFTYVAVMSMQQTHVIRRAQVEAKRRATSS